MHGILTIFRKEVAAFLDSLIAYVVIAIFLTGVGLFFWVFSYNVLEPGSTYARMDALFLYGPYLFLFLVPAITMRAFSEEKRTGTLEWLITQPLTDWEIILGKYLAAVFLVFLALIPTLIYVVSLYILGDPPGNLDVGETIGAYLGLFFLGAIFAAIGIFTSALSENQIIAFIFAVFLCFVFYMGFEFLAGTKGLGVLQTFGLKLGIQEHYRSIARGVIDTRDLLYFVSMIAGILILTYLVIRRR